ncbi:MAG: hypothetical protein ACKOE8_14475 [Opitutaceae bacterium]
MAPWNPLVNHVPSSRGFAALASADTGRPVTPGKARRAPGH